MHMLKIIFHFTSLSLYFERHEDSPCNLYGPHLNRGLYNFMNGYKYHFFLELLNFLL